jgi:hypothetical protein
MLEPWDLNGAQGFYVSEDPEAGSCPFIEEYGYT